MRVIRMGLAYEGAGFSGFALQPGRRTVQGVVESALGGILGHSVRVTPAGRTDAGVHAHGQVVSFETSARVPAAAISRAVASRLPDDLIAGPSEEAPAGFDARRSARLRHYRYSIWRGERPSLCWRRYSLHLPIPLDLEAMNAAAGALVGRHDFASFVGHSSQEEPGASTVRTLEQARWTTEGERLSFECSGDAFARHMVRNIVGTLLCAGQGRIRADEVARVLDARDRRAAGPTAPAHGLTLMNVDYDDQESQR